MRDLSETLRRPFTSTDVANKDLVVKMLRHEDSIMTGHEGAAIFADETLQHLTELDTYHIFHRMTLATFGFQTAAKDVLTYRTIFSHYYRNPTDYDKDVLSSVCYMRENKCVYYTAPQVNVGDSAVDTELLTLDGASTSLNAELLSLKHKYVFVGAFSTS